MSETSYTPGTWFGIVGADATVVLPPTAKSRAGALWALVDDGAGFDEVLDALVADGLSGLPGFVLIATEGDATRVVVRGAAAVTCHTPAGPVVVEGASGLTWVERSLSDVAGYAVTLDEEPAGAAHVFTGGLVRISSLRSPAEEPAAAAEPTVAAPAVAEPAAFPAPPVEPAVVDDPLTGPLPVADEEPEEPEAAPDELGYDDAPTDVDIPAYAPPAPAFPPPPFAPPLGAPVGVPDLDAPEEPEPEPEPEIAPASSVVARLELSSGQRVEVDRVVVIGRAPDPARFSHVDQPLMVTVPSPHQEISSTHLEVRPGSGAEQGTALVTDLGSTNGTVLVRPGQGPEELRPGVPVALVPGAVIDLGDGLTITVA